MASSFGRSLRRLRRRIRDRLDAASITSSYRRAERRERVGRFFRRARRRLAWSPRNRRILVGFALFVGGGVAGAWGSDYLDARTEAQNVRVSSDGTARRPARAGVGPRQPRERPPEGEAAPDGERPREREARPAGRRPASRQPRPISTAAIDDDVTRLARRLGLTPEQRDSLRAVVHRGVEQATTAQARMEGAVDSTYAGVRAILDPRQLVVFDSLTSGNRDPVARWIASRR